jgi:hypothetical protein
VSARYNGAGALLRKLGAPESPRPAAPAKVASAVVPPRRRPAVWCCAACGLRLDDKDRCPSHGLDVEGRRLSAIAHLAAREACSCELCERAAIVWEARGMARGRGEYEAVCLEVVDQFWTRS